MGKTLFPHQEQGVSYLQNGGGYLFWKPRTGKTLTSIYGVLDDISKPLSYMDRKVIDKYPVLVITKPSIMETFYRAFVDDFGLPGHSVVICRTKWTRKKRLAALQDGLVVICNYQMAIAYRVMEAREWGAIIFDESYALANISAKVTRYILRAIPTQPEFQKRVVLSGTPASESPLQYASQFFIVDGHYMGYYNITDYVHENWKFDGRKMVPRNRLHLAAIKDYVQEKASMLSLEDLGKGSPKLYSVRKVGLNKDQLGAIQWAIIQKHKLNSMFSGGDFGRVGDMVYGLYENMVSAGIDPVTKTIISTAKIEDVLEMYHDCPEPTLVFSHFVAPLSIAKDLATREGLRAEQFSGTTPKEEVERIRNDFQEGKLDIVFAQSEVAAEGIDFSRANRVFYLNNSFSLNTREQTEERVININKTEPVEIIDICTEGTLDLKIVKKLRAKEKISNEFLRKESIIGQSAD